ncbi:MAG TPA: hypothetical protein VJT49_03535 [Amycolatopsis sp.]|nr:hypothetical protein [Amycolatopsis sp.]HKS44187.1 hypothetical protein [Amycolatopsis sp.]
MSSPTGRRIALCGNAFFGFRAGKVADIRPIIDVYGLQARLAAT